MRPRLVPPLAAGLAALFAAVPATASPTRPVDLLTDARAEYSGPRGGAGVGGSVALGDYDGDGRLDLAIAGAPDEGSVRVLLGGLGASVDLAGGGSGFDVRLLLAAADTDANTEPDALVATVGDVNGDGRDDLAVWARGTAPRAGIVLGSASPRDVTIDHSGPSTPRDPAVWSVRYNRTATATAASFSGVGDVNGDGRDDVALIGTDLVAVVFGDPTSPVAVLPTGGIVRDDGGHDTPVGGFIVHHGPSNGATFGDTPFVAAAAGDVTGDGLGDLLVGAPSIAPGGRAWMVEGKGGTVPVDLEALGSAGYEIRGAGGGDGAGSTVADIGDQNGDGVPDHLIGAPWAGAGLEGRAYVVFGRRTTRSPLQLGSLGSRGYAIGGAHARQGIGLVAAGGVSISGDASPDVVLAAPASGEGGRGGQGAVYVVEGGGRRNVDLGSDDWDGYRIDGPQADAGAGASVALARTGSGTALVVGAPGTDTNARRDSGVVYLTDLRARLTVPVEPILAPRVRTYAEPVQDRIPVNLAVARASEVTFGVRRRATVRVSVQRIVPGRRSGARTQVCRTGAAAPATGRGCTTLRTVRTLRSTVSPGAPVRLGLVGRRLKGSLPAGRYVVAVRATDTRGRAFGPWRRTLTVRG